MPLTQEVLKTYWKQLLLRVHPDFFASYPEIRIHNEKAIKQFSSLLFSSQRTIQPDKVPSLVSFYAKQSRNHQSSQGPFSLFNAELKSPLGVSSKTGNIDRALLQLCQQVGIHVSPEDLKLCTSPPEDSYTSKSTSSKHAQNLDQYKKLSRRQDLINSLRPISTPPVPLSRITSMRELFFKENRLVFFSHLLTRGQIEFAKQNLWETLPKLTYSSWQAYPLLFSLAYSRDTQGVLIVPFNFTQKGKPYSCVFGY
jgi:hypothetical protein